MSTFAHLIPADRKGHKDLWLLLLFAVHLGHAFIFAYLYPSHQYDTDLLAYFLYFRNWLDGSVGFSPAQFFVPIPKPLLCFTLGPLGNAQWAFYCTAFFSALLGSLVYLIGRRFFDRSVGLLLSAFLLLDSSKGLLTVGSSADLYLTFCLFLALYLTAVQRPWLSSTCLFLSALVKPVTLPCSLYFFLGTEKDTNKKWLWGTLPFLAIPLLLLGNRALLGSTDSPTRLFAEFTALRETTPLSPQHFLHFVFWTQLVQFRFVLTAPWGFLGILLWLTGDKRRLTSPFFLFPLFFLVGYWALSIVSPYTPFFRFYWPIEIWFLAFVIYGIVEGARRMFTTQAWVRKGAICLLLFFLLNDAFRYYFTYRNRFVLPFEEGMAFVTTATEVLKREKRKEETVLTSVAFVPYVMWELQVQDWDLVIPVEEMGVKQRELQPDWIVYVPQVLANPEKAKDLVSHLVDQGEYEVRLRNETSALLRRPINGS